jgi:hypothetical protein
VNLRELAEADNAMMLEDESAGFGVAIKLTKPNSSIAVAAVLTASASGDNGTVLPANTRWVAGEAYYRQAAAATIAAGVAAVVLTAEVAGDAGNLENGEVLELVTPTAGAGDAVVTGTTVEGLDRDPDVVYEVKGQYHRVGVDVDPETGLPVPGNKSTVTVRLSSLGEGVLPDEGWLVETTDITGAAVKGRVKYPMLDRTSGRATLVLGR